MTVDGGEGENTVGHVSIRDAYRQPEVGTYAKCRVAVHWGAQKCTRLIRS